MRFAFGLRLLNILISAALLLIACADTDGRNPYALWEKFVHPDGDYSFYYLSPPWSLYNTSSVDPPDLQIVTVEATSDSPDASVETGAIEARFKAVISLRGDTSAAEEAAADAMRLSAAADVAVKVEDFKNYRGQVGAYFSVRLPDRYIRSAYFDAPSHSTAVMQLVGRESVSGADFTLFLQGLQPEAAEQ